MGEKTSHRTVPESPAPRADAEKIATPDGRDGEKAPALESRVRPGTGSSRGSLRGSLTLALITLLWLLTASYFVRVFHLLHGREHYEDFAVFYLSALELRADIDPYGTSFVPLERTLGMNTHSKERGTHPPTFLALFEPLTVLPVSTAYWTWTALNFVALVGALVLLLGRRSVLDPRSALALGALAFWYAPVFLHFMYGHSNMLVLLMLVLMMRWMEQGNSAGAGLIFALAGLIRVFPLPIGAYLLLTRRWRVLAYTAIGLAIGAAATLFLVGTSHSLNFFYVVPGHFNHNRGIATPWNIAMGAFISRIFWWIWGPQLGPAPGYLRAAVIICADLSVLALGARATLMRNIGDDPDWRVFSLWVVTSLMLSPTVWLLNLVLLLLPFIQLVSAFSHRRANRHALDMALASVLLAFVALASYLSDFRTYPFLKTPLEECGFGSLLAAYISTYWFATDGSAGEAGSADEGRSCLQKEIRQIQQGGLKTGRRADRATISPAGSATPLRYALLRECSNYAARYFVSAAITLSIIASAFARISSSVASWIG